MCPVPSCGTKLFTDFELRTHLVAFHRLPVCGTTRHTLVRHLRLPSPPDAPAPRVDLAQLTDVDLPAAMEVDARDPDDAPTKSKGKGKERARDPSPSRKRKARRPRTDSEYCVLCIEWLVFLLYRLQFFPHSCQQVFQQHFWLGQSLH